MQAIASAGLKAWAFIHRFGSSLDAHRHFRCMVSGGVFDVSPTGGTIVRAATGLDAEHLLYESAWTAYALPGDATGALDSLSS